MVKCLTICFLHWATRKILFLNLDAMALYRWKGFVYFLSKNDPKIILNQNKYPFEKYLLLAYLVLSSVNIDLCKLRLLEE